MPSEEKDEAGTVVLTGNSLKEAVSDGIASFLATQEVMGSGLPSVVRNAVGKCVSEINLMQTVSNAADEAMANFIRENPDFMANAIKSSIESCTVSWFNNNGNQILQIWSHWMEQHGGEEVARVLATFREEA